MATIAQGFSVVVFLIAIWGAPARAHGVFVFAWEDGRRICTESYFSGGNKVRGGAVTMADSRGTVLGTVATDDAGLACFEHPGVKGDVVFTVQAGQGHQGTFTLPIGEPGAPTGSEEKTAAREPVLPSGESRQAASVSAGTALTANPLSSAPEAVSQEAVRAIVREELQAALGPIRRALAEGRETREPGIRDIVGGIGWIVGLAAGLGWWATRRKRNR